MLNEMVTRVLEEFKRREIEKVFLVGCGGSSALMYASKYAMDHEAKTIDSDLYSSNEFIHRHPAKLGEKSLVILCSHYGKTPETVNAARFAREKGALTVSLTYEPDSPLAEASEFVILYQEGKEHPFLNDAHAIMYELVFGLLHIKEGNPKYDALIEALSHLRPVIEKAKEQALPAAQAFGRAYQDATNIYTMASGANYGIAYWFAICILMEMQWIHSHAIHAGEYFHGPFEILDKEVPMIQLVGLDETRPLEERSLGFSRQYGDNIITLDAKDFDLTGVDDRVKGYIAPLVLHRVLRVYAEELAHARNHPLTTRRYMWKVAY
ncbi:SIS domain-containing protein [Brevibacillus choshinensis]|uniref:Fructosamine deglycase n=1 Tax=Brevibacillus choshinensis TaxID=54911 RepID=A0ABX7FV59_BRECH|nr:SIS domain-containing protein [Brevibacillus choshinensis]QRG68875.1 SIS domain-containing protein [Brevibacillus choshinensis]